MRHERSLRAPGSRLVQRRYRVATGLLVALVLALPALLPGAASADQLSDKQAQARQIAGKLDQLEQKLSQLDEKFNEATIGLDQANAAVADAQKRLDETNAELAQSSGDLQKFAVQAYMNGNDTGSFEAILTSTADQATQRRSYLEAASGNKQDIIDKLAAVRQKADEEMHALNQAQAQAQTQSDAIKSAKDDADAAVAEQSSLNAQAQGELKVLVDQERARQAAAQAAAAAKAIAAAQAAQPPARKVTTNPNPQTPSNPTPKNPVVTDPPPDDGGGGSGTPGAATAIAAARSQLGVPYVWGGASPGHGFDCSGLVMWAWAQAGRSLPHSSAAMWSSTRHVSLSALQPGDLIFYGSPVHHVALYIGGGQIIHAPHTGSVVSIASVNYWSDIRGAGRL